MPRKTKSSYSGLQLAQEADPNPTDDEYEFSDSEGDEEEALEHLELTEDEEEPPLDHTQVVSLGSVATTCLKDAPLDGLTLGFIREDRDRRRSIPYRISPLIDSLTEMEVQAKASIDGLFVFDSSLELVTFLRLPDATFQLRSNPKRSKFKQHVRIKRKVPSRRRDRRIWKDLPKKDALNLDLGSLTAFNLTFELGLLLPGTRRTAGTQVAETYNSLLRMSFLKSSTIDPESRHILIEPFSVRSSEQTQPVSKKVGLSVLREVLGRMREEYPTLILHAMFVGSKTAKTGEVDALESLVPFIGELEELQTEWRTVYREDCPEDLEEKMGEGLILVDPSIEITATHGEEEREVEACSSFECEVKEDLTVSPFVDLGGRGCERVAEGDLLFTLWRRRG